MNLRLKRTPGVYLAGFVGAGMSTVARHLAQRLGWQFFDTDAEIEAKERKSIAEILVAQGEAEFRRMETEVIRHHVRWIERGRPAVMALGGGALAVVANRELMEHNGITVWLDSPLAPGSEACAALDEARREHYRLADVHVAVESDDPEVTVAAILAHPLFQ